MHGSFPASPSPCCQWMRASSPSPRTLGLTPSTHCFAEWWRIEDNLTSTIGIMLFFQLIVIARRRTWTQILLQPRSKRYFFVQLVLELSLSTSSFIDVCMFLQSLSCHRPLTCEVCQIHRRLPPGGILVFMTGQVSYIYSFFFFQ